MAVSNQDIINFLTTNPGMSDADIASAMAQYGVSPSQMAQVTGLSEGEVVSRVAATVPPGQAKLLGDTWVQPQYQVSGSGENQQIGGIEGVSVYKTTGGINDTPTVGTDIQNYTPTGEYVNTTQVQDTETSFFGGLADMFNDPVIQAAVLGLGGGGALGNALGLTGTTAQAVGTGLLKGGAAAAGGADIGDALKAGLLSGGLVYGAGALDNYLATGSIADPGITERQLAIADAKQLADQGLSQSQIADVLGSSGYNEVMVESAIKAATKGLTPTTIPTSTAATDVVNITGTATPAINAGGLLGSLVPTTVTPTVTPPSNQLETVKVTGTSTPQQVDQAVLNLINSQLATNVTTPANLANVQVTADKGMMSNTDTTSAILNTIAGLPTTPAATDTLANVTVTGQTPATTQELVSALTATLPAATTPITTPTTTTTPEVKVTAQKPTSINDIVTAAAIPLIQPSVPLEVTPVTAAKTNELGLTDAQMANLLKAGLGLFGTLGATSALSNMGSTTNPIGLPTQLPPVYTGDYFTRVQQNYNQLLPAVPRDVATPLRDWYTSQYGA